MNQQNNSTNFTAIPPKGSKKTSFLNSPRLRNKSDTNLSESGKNNTAQVLIHTDAKANLKSRTGASKDAKIRWKRPSSQLVNRSLGKPPAHAVNKTWCFDRTVHGEGGMESTRPESDTHPMGSPSIFLQPLPTALGDHSGDPSVLMAQEWIDRYSATSAYFSSDAVYCELKLKEVRRITERMGIPSRLRTAISADLYHKICQKLGPLSDLFCELKNELFASIYVDLDSSLPYPQALIQATPYYVENRKLQIQNEELRAKIVKMKDAQNRTMNQDKNKRLIEMYARKWLKQNLWRTFGNWAKYTKAQKSNRLHMVNILAHMRQKQISPREVLWAWRLETFRQRSSGFAVADIQRKAQANRQELLWSQKIHEKEAEISRLKEDKKDLKHQLESVEKMLKSGRGEVLRSTTPIEGMPSTSSPLKEVKMDPQFSRLLCEVLRFCLMLGVQAMSYLGGTIAEVALTPTAHTLVAMIAAETPALQDRMIAPLPHEVLTSKLFGEDSQIFHSVSKLNQDALLLHWANVHLQKVMVGQTPYTRQLLNFGDDLKDGEIYSALLHAIFPYLGTVTLISKGEVTMKTKTRVQTLCTLLQKIDPVLPCSLTPEQVLNCNERMNAIFIFHLYMRTNGFVDPQEILDREVEAFQDLQTCWLGLQKNSQSLLSYIETGEDSEDTELTSRCLDGLRLLNAKFPRISSQLELVLIRTRLGNRVYHKMMRRMHEFLWSLNPPNEHATSWSTGEASNPLTNLRTKQITDALSIEPSSIFQAIYQRFDPGMDPDEMDAVHAKVMKVIRNSFGDIEYVFNFCTHGQDKMTVFGFWCWVHMSRILLQSWSRRHKVVPKDIDAILNRIAPTDEWSVSSPNLEAQISRAEFAYSLVHMAVLFDPPDQSHGLDTVIGLFVQRSISTIAQKLRMGEIAMNLFTSELLNPQAFLVLTKYASELYSSFQEYSENQQMPLFQMVTFFSDFEILKEVCATPDDLIRMVVQMREEWSLSIDLQKYQTSGPGLSFVEFVEIVAASSHFVVSNPFEQFDDRLQLFISKKVLPFCTAVLG